MNVSRDMAHIRGALKARPDLHALEVRCLSYAEATVIFHQLTRSERQRIHLTWPALSGYWKLTVAVCELLTNAARLLRRTLSSVIVFAASLENQQGDCATSQRVCETYEAPPFGRIHLGGGSTV